MTVIMSALAPKIRQAQPRHREGEPAPRKRNSSARNAPVAKLSNWHGVKRNTPRAGSAPARSKDNRMMNAPTKHAAQTPAKVRQSARNTTSGHSR